MQIIHLCVLVRACKITYIILCVNFKICFFHTCMFTYVLFICLCMHLYVCNKISLHAYLYAFHIVYYSHAVLVHALTYE